MVGRPDGLDAAALVHGNVHDDRAGEHSLNKAAGNEVRRLRSGDEHGADNEIGLHDSLADGEAGRGDGIHPATENVVEILEAVVIDVEDGDARAESDGDPGRVLADHPRPEDDHVAARDAGRPGKENAPPAHAFFEKSRALLNRHAARDLAHGLKQGQCAVGCADGLESHRLNALSHQGARERPGSGKMEKRKENLPLAHPIEFGPKRLLDLDDHLAAPPERISPRHDPGAGAGEHLIVDAGPLARALLHQDGVARSPDRLNGGRRERDAMLVFFDLLGYADNHGAPPSLLSTRRKVLSASATTTPSLARMTLPSRIEKRPFFRTSRPSIRSGSPTGTGSR